MFQEDYEKLTRGEQRQFEDAVNDLLYTCLLYTSDAADE